jgi:putative endopeptidase
MHPLRTRLSVFAFAVVIGVRVLPPALAQHDATAHAPSALHGPDTANLDRTCKPCDDFYHYVNGGWLKKNPVPPDYPSWGRFNELQEKNREHLRDILEAAAKATNAPEGSIEQKIGDFYASCMNESKVEAEGIKPLAPEFERLDQVHDLPSLQAEIAHLQGDGASALFGFRSTQDARNSTQVIGGATQGGLGLPDRDYYTKTDEKSRQIREQYVGHVTRMFQLLGDDSAKAAVEAKTVMSIETKLAEASVTRVERRDPDKTYHKMDLEQLAQAHGQLLLDSLLSRRRSPRRLDRRRQPAQVL